MEDCMTSAVRALDIRSKMIGVLLRAARLRAGKTIKECAEWLGCSSHIMSQYEYGRRGISLPELEVLAQVFRVPLDHLWNEEVDAVEQSSPDLPASKFMELRHKEVGVLLRQARSEAGKTQRECADMLGVTPDTISKYEFCKRPVPFTHLEMLVPYLDVPVTTFVNQDTGTNRVPGRGFERDSDAEVWAGLPAEIREFVCNPESLPYLQMALRLSELPPESLRRLAEAMLSTEDESGRQSR
jgi:transcriptional regulator with XRE-family HTH domain